MKTIKSVLLSVLTLSEYRRVTKNMTDQYGQKHRKLILRDETTDNDSSVVASLFRWSATQQGRRYWSAIAVRDTKPKEGKFARLIKWFIRFIPALMIVMIVSSCQKDKPVEPKKQRVYYEVQCADCLIILESDKWNSSNELERSKNQSFNVTGKFKYSFENNTLDSAKFSIFVSVFSPKQQIVARAYTNDGHTADLSGWYGLDYPNDNPLQREAVLKLK